MKGIKLQQELQLELLQIKEITTCRQRKNGTRIFQLPIKKYGQYIEVGSFKSGYVRRMNGGYTPYQLNKTEDHDHFYPAYEWKTLDNGDYTQVKTGKYDKHICRRRILIPHEVDRIQYLIAYCLKNYYINQANMIEDGKFVPKWKHEYEIEKASKYTWSGGQITTDTGEIYVHEQHAYWNKLPNSVEVIVDGHRYKIK